MSEISESLRKEFGTNDAKRDQGLTTPEDVIRYDNIRYAADPVWNLLDVYRPRQLSGTLPVIIIYHGGGWVYGTKEVYQFYGMSLAQRGFAVINFTYRLAPEHRFPSPLEDMNSVIDWMYENAQKYLLDMDNVFIVGDSAGAHLTGLFCAICTDRRYADNFKFRVKSGFVPRAIGMNCGAYELFKDGVPLQVDDRTTALMKDFLPEENYDETTALVNVSELVNPKFPPAYIMTAKGDSLLKQAPILEEAYRRNGVLFKSKVYGDEDNKLYHVFHCAITEDAAKQCNGDECEFFRSQIK